MKFKSPKLLVTLSMISCLTILAACADQTGSIANTPPTTATIPRTDLNPLFCDEVSPFHWDGGTKPDATMADILLEAKKPNTATKDIRALIGDTDETIIQAKKINAMGVRLCGWHTD